MLKRCISNKEWNDRSFNKLYWSKWLLILEKKKRKPCYLKGEIQKGYIYILLSEHSNLQQSECWSCFRKNESLCICVWVGECTGVCTCVCVCMWVGMQMHMLLCMYICTYISCKALLVHINLFMYLNTKGNLVTAYVHLPYLIPHLPVYEVNASF